ncbi:MAG: cupin domain-containing protein [Azospirillum sp.]|nr:cupin domain-containing protein [Azospirillum sp.]
MKSRNAAFHSQKSLDESAIPHLVAAFSSNRVFSQPSSFTNDDNPYSRPLRPQDMLTINPNKKLNKSDFITNEALLLQRMLTAIYETDLLYLPEKMDRERREAFDAFYDDGLKVLGERLRPTLEGLLFGFLGDEIDVGGKWTVQTFRTWAEDALTRVNSSQSEVVQTILGLRNPSTAADEFLIQLSSDFLSEASAMARNVLGNFGPAQSGLFTILIDEYGYGVHSEKHSSIFEITLKSRNLDSRPHAYWQYYLPSSLALVNYFHYISRNHRLFGRYAGALLFTEATLVEANRQQSWMLHQIFDENVNTRYFDEHVHIDAHHGRMALDRVIVPLVERCGDWVLEDIVRGFEEFKLLQQLADIDLIEQVRFADRLFKAPMTGDMWATFPGIWDVPDVLEFAESRGEISVLHIHNHDELFEVTEGEIEFTVGPLHSVILSAGNAIVIPAGRLHGSKVLSERCRYRVRNAAGLRLAA